MNNGDKPAYPISEEETNRVDALVNIYFGLTKREMFAAMAMQGMASYHGTQGMGNTCSSTAERAIELADELLKQLQ